MTRRRSAKRAPSGASRHHGVPRHAACCGRAQQEHCPQARARRASEGAHRAGTARRDPGRASRSSAHGSAARMRCSEPATNSSRRRRPSPTRSPSGWICEYLLEVLFFNSLLPTNIRENI
eukprot:scaffold244653_cov36-Tisochrysis_lutea.AAC.2